MPRVVDVNGNTLANVSDDLLKDFFYDMLMGHEADHNVAEYLAQLDPTPRLKLSEYIVERLAEVDPGYVPEVAHDSD